MDLTVRPYHKNLHPLAGILIRGERVTDWLREIQQMGLSLSGVQVYPIPGLIANTLWGCLVAETREAVELTAAGVWPADGRGVVPGKRDIGRNNYCQCIDGQLFVPVNSRLYPEVTSAELGRLLKDRLHFFHPETGWMQLSAPVDWKALLLPPVAADKIVITPEATVFVPDGVHRFYIQATSPEEVLGEMEKELFPEGDPDRRPLSPWEKIKLFVLRALFGKAGKKEARWPKWLSFLRPKRQPKWVDKLLSNLENLEERNNREVGKLLELFEKDPKLALRYAIPIDNEGTSRGRGGEAAYRLGPRWGEFSGLFGGLGGLAGLLAGGLAGLLAGGPGGGGSGGGSVRLGHDYATRLNQQYRETARQLAENKEYKEAAYVYLRLLKDYSSAAQTLENGKFYSEAASIYLKYEKNKLKAAECYEKGRMPVQAIELYKDLQMDEKIGDIYLSIDKPGEAAPYFETVIGQYAANQQYIKASLVCRDKLGEEDRAQVLLLEGWRSRADAVNCLNYYFAAIRDVRELEQEIQKLYRETEENDKSAYLEVMKKQYPRHSETATVIRDIAYAIIAEKLAGDPFMASELQAFNQSDKHLPKDILKYKQGKV